MKTPRISLSIAALLAPIYMIVPVSAIPPEYKIEDGTVRLTGVGPDNPIIYDNDWWYDVVDNNYLWAQASLGKADLRGNIVSRDMWDWQKGYHHSMERSLDDAGKALKLARESGLKNIPGLTRGSDQALKRPTTGKIEDTRNHPTDGSRLIVVEAKKASPEKPLLVISGGPLTTVANALLTNPEIAPNLVVFNLTVNGGYNGKDGWSVHIVTKLTRYVDWGGGEFWDKDSVFTPEHFEGLKDNPFTKDMKRLIQTGLGRANQLGDGAPLVWLYEPKCWKTVEFRESRFNGSTVEFHRLEAGQAGNVLVIPKSGTDLKECRNEFFRVMNDEKLFR